MPSRLLGVVLCRLVFVSLIAFTSPARAFVISEDELEEKSTELNLLVRSFSFVLASPVLRSPYSLDDANPTASGLFDLRSSLIQKNPWLKVVIDAQLSGLIRSHAILDSLAIGRGSEPPRFFPLQTNISSSDTLSLRAVVDWAYLSIVWGPLTIALGRQPITFGRGKLWKPTDLISSFSLTEVDTEFKPGTDALRIDLSATDRTMVTLIATAGKWFDRPTPAQELSGFKNLEQSLSLRGSAFVARAKQSWSRGEAGLLVGYIRQDVVLAADAIFDLGSVDLYAEITTTLVFEESLSPRRPTTDRAVPRAVAGLTIKPVNKLTIIPELFYNGFGAWDKADYLTVALSERTALGELSNLGRLYFGSSLLWEAHPLLNLSLATIVNLRDPSGLLYMGLSYNLASNMDLLAGAYIPIARVPDLKNRTLLGPLSMPTPRSEFGLYPSFVFLELKAAM